VSTVSRRGGQCPNCLQKIVDNVDAFSMRCSGPEPFVRGDCLRLEFSTTRRGTISVPVEVRGGDDANLVLILTAGNLPSGLGEVGTPVRIVRLRESLVDVGATYIVSCSAGERLVVVANPAAVDQVLTTSRRALSVPVGGIILRAGATEQAFDGLTEDVSPGGCRLRTTTETAFGDEVAFRFVPDAPVHLAVRGTVLDVETPRLGGPKFYAVRVRFTHLSPAVARWLLTIDDRVHSR
jgi:hypothetical protein